MAIRYFADPDGTRWSMWPVQPTTLTGSHLLAEQYRGGWLCFESAETGERYRLSLEEVPPAWESLSDDRLALVRRMAVLTRAPSVTSTPIAAQKAIIEEEARNRVSGPKAMVGDDEDD
ncbi:MAG TPA: hypothetical protein VF929_11930 [Gemmatimonadaceae bacterium]